MATWVNLMDIVYPIGSMYIANSSTSPASIIGGSWAQITNAALRGATSVGYTGSDTHTIALKEIPNHDHALTWAWGEGDSGYIPLGTVSGEHPSSESGSIRNWGGAISNVYCPTFLQLFYLVQNSLRKLVM